MLSLLITAHLFLSEYSEVFMSIFHFFQLISVDKRGLANHWTCALKQEDFVEGLHSKNTSEDVKKMWYDKTKR